MCGYVDATYWRDMGTPEGLPVRGSADLVRGIAPSPALPASAVKAWSTTRLG